MSDDAGNTLLPFRSDRQNWQTPAWLFTALDHEFSFDLDAAASPDNALCERYLTEADNALAVPWDGVSAAFVNPPYGKANGGLGAWTAKALAESLLGRTVVMLIPARVEAGWWTRSVLQAAEVRFVAQRVTFVGGANPAPVGSAVVVFRPPVTFPGPDGSPYMVRPLMQPAVSYMIREDA